MLAKFLHFRIGKTITAFAILGLAFIVYSLAVSFPVLSIGDFLFKTRLSRNGKSLHITYPPAVIVAEIADRGAVIMGTDGKKQSARVKLQLVIADVEPKNVHSLGVKADDFDEFKVFAECGTVKKEDMRFVRKLMRRMPHGSADEVILQRTSVSPLQLAVIRLLVGEKPFTIIVRTAGSRIAPNGRIIYIRTKVLGIRS